MKVSLSGSLDYRPPPESRFKPVLLAPLVAVALAGKAFWWLRRRRA
jgi:hypothetical protein